MTKEEIKKYKKILEEEKARLEREKKEREGAVDFGSDVDGADEEADETEETGNQQAVSQTIKKQLKEIEGALLRIEEGRYGICLKCRGEISRGVLSIVPESELCVNCKRKN
jgi:DnaK suppressor protein